MNLPQVKNIRPRFTFSSTVFLCLVFSCSGTPGQQEAVENPSPENALKAYYTGRIEDAAAEFEALAAVNPDGKGVKRQLAVLYRELGERQGAVKLQEELADSAEDQAALFETYYLSGDIKKASAWREAALSVTAGGESRVRSDILFYAAMLSADEGNDEQAMELFRESLALNRYRPAAWFNLGKLLEKSSPRDAESCYRNTLAQDSAFTQALYPLGRLLAARKAWPQAEDVLGRAARRYPENREIAAAYAAARRSGGVSAYDLLRRRISAKAPRVPPAAAGGTLVRIGLAERRELVSVKAGGDFTLNAEDFGAYRGAAGEQFWMAWAGQANENPRPGNLAVQNGNGKAFIRSGKNLSMEYRNPGDTTIITGIVSGSPGISRTYRGKLEFIPTPEGITIVNILPLEDYLYSVVPSEMPASWPDEALKAQAIAARSYTLANLGQFAGRGFDLYGTPYSMAYQGLGTENRKTTAAVNATRGIVLRAGKETIKAYFSANHGGYSEDSLVMWGYDAHMAAVPDLLLPERKDRLPPWELDAWIRAVPPSYSSVNRYHFASSYRWEKWVAADEIRHRLRERGGDPGELKRIVSRGRGISGRIYELEVAGSEQSISVKGDAIWAAMGALRSSLFTIGYKFDRGGKIEYVIFRGAGHGHGIGLDQHGAAGMAASGFNAAEILRHYYPRAEIIRL